MSGDHNMHQKPTGMNALEMAQWIEDDNTCDGDEKIVAMLRRQHEAIKQLREALDHAKDYAPIDGYAFEAAVKALKDTEEICKTQ